MIKTIYICDRCGAEIPDRIGYLDWAYIDRNSGEKLDTNVFEINHFCEKCMGEIRTFIAGGRIEMPVEPEQSKHDLAENCMTADCAEHTAEPEPEPEEMEPPAEPESEDGPAEAATEPQKKKRNRKDFDRGKVIALYRAGWKAKEIVDEFHGKITENDVWQTTYQYRRKQKAAQAVEEGGGNAHEAG